MIELLQFQWQGFQEIIKAHQMGEKDNAALKYIEAWVSTVMYGDDARVPEDLPAQVEPVRLGKADGQATLALWGEARDEQAKRLLAQYGSQPYVKRALQTELCKRAGFEGLKFHDGE